MATSAARFRAPGFPERLAFLQGALPAAARVLDLGCGEGRFAAALRDAGHSPLAADVAAEALRRVGDGIPTLLVPAEGELPLPDSELDAVWLGEVLEHVADTQRFLSEVRRVLRPQGTLVISTPDHSRWQALRWALSPARFDEDFDPRGEHLRFYTRRTLAEVLREMRFAVLELRSRRGTLLAHAQRERW